MADSPVLYPPPYTYNTSSSPSDLAIITAAEESLNTLTVVRIMSRTRSVTMGMPIPSGDRPTAARITIISTRLAVGMPATPMEVSKGTSTIVNWAARLKPVGLGDEHGRHTQSNHDRDKNFSVKFHVHFHVVRVVTATIGLCADRQDESEHVVRRDIQAPTRNAERLVQAEMCTTSRSFQS